MEDVTVEFYFDESKNKSSLDKAREFIMELFNQKGLSCIENNEKNIIFRDIQKIEDSTKMLMAYVKEQAVYAELAFYFVNRK